jgi:hypothetical protein
LTTFAIQYLERSYPDATPATVRRRLRQACEYLPISLVLLGWELPRNLEEAVAEETSRQHAQLFRWQPILTGDSHAKVPPEWAVQGPGGDPILGYGDFPEFSFICPNRSGVTDFLSERVESIAATGLFQGLFLDRIRFPSPALDPRRDLACFCPSCFNFAADLGLELDSIRRDIASFHPKAFVRSLLGKPDENDFRLESFLDFRSASITRTVRNVVEQAHSLNLSIGLDCFSPVLARMVGQNLSALDGTADWVKIMTYPRVFSPAGISFELSGLSKWLINTGLSENEAMHLLADACKLPIPANEAELEHLGLGSETISREIQHGYELGITYLLAGIAMVQLPNIHQSSLEQIQADLDASRSADGLVISWDLWLIPLEYMEQIRSLWS